MSTPRLSANTTATSNPFSLNNNSTLDFFLLFGQRQLSVPIQVIPLSLQCYGTTLPSLTRLVSAPAHRASVTCGARKLLSLISCHQNVLAQPSQSTKRNRMWGWGQWEVILLSALSNSQMSWMQYAVSAVPMSRLPQHHYCTDKLIVIVLMNIKEVEITNLYFSAMYLLQAQIGSSSLWSWTESSRYIEETHKWR